jgi:hypothetical protein
MENKFKVGDRVLDTKYREMVIITDICRFRGGGELIIVWHSNGDHLLQMASNLKFPNNALQRLKERYGKHV